jgi:hypothetical protein
LDAANAQRQVEKPRKLSFRAAAGGEESASFLAFWQMQTPRLDKDDSRWDVFQQTP